MRRVLLLIALLLAAANATAQDVGGTVEQQEQLDQLFGKLRTTDLGPDAFTTEAKIWDIWLQGGNPDENQVLNAAATAMALGNYADSERLLNQLIGRTAVLPEAFNKRATLYFLMGRYDESLADIVMTLELEPRHFGALSGRGMILQMLGRNGDALGAYRDALAINPHMPGARLAIQQLEKLAPDL
jgi:tetratricopeptide (TPR) repeat protein